MRNHLLLAGFFLFVHSLCSQQPVSIMQEESMYYKNLGIDADEYYTINQPRNMAHLRSGNCTLNRMVFGWHPYWMNGAEDNYQWNLLSDLCYFSYEVDPNTGNATSTHSFATNDAVDTALAHGVRVHLCVTLFSSHATFFGNTTARNTLISNLKTMIQNRGAHGVNIDFEGVPSSQKTNLTNFMIALCDTMHAANPNYKVSICTYAVDWNDVFDEAALAPHLDFITIMGYDYYWSGSSQAGPNDPLYGFSSGYDYALSRSVSYYKSQGMPEQKIVLGLPYYGREWETSSGTVPTSTTGNFNASRTYSFVKDNTSGNYTNGLDNQRSVAHYYTFQVSGNWRQCWISEGYELRKRYDFINQQNLAGIGIWALGYDDGYNDLWDAIEEKLTDCAIHPCVDTIYDGGGPLVDYYNNESYTYTIAPDNATQVTLSFQSFATEAGHDTLWIYDGPDANAPLIGAYDGSSSPGFITSSGNALTLRFRSDGGTRAAGWMAVTGCILDNVPPVTQITAPSGWITEDFQTSYTDFDNLGVHDRFWNVSDFNGSEWRSNAALGFFNDNFNTAIHPEWMINTGVWSISSGKLMQTDEALNNTNIFAYVNQDTADVYLYEWKGSTAGNGTNRRSGFHFFCDDAIMDNRGNSYFVWFRLDDAKLQIYKTINDAFFLQHEVPFTTIAGQEYAYRVVYNKTTGKIEVWADNIYITSWTDSAPYQTGQHVSFRSGSSLYTVDDLRVYQLRTVSESVTTGDTSAMFRYQNPDPQTPAGRISTVINDESHLFSVVADTLFNVDWTAPVPGHQIADGLGIDEDTIINLNSFGGHWDAFSDPNSGIAQRYYGLGTIPGLDNIIAYTPTAIDSCQFSTAGFTPYAVYYLSAYTVNTAGLISDTLTSDGFMYIYDTWGIEESSDQFYIYPNPASGSVWLNIPEQSGEIRLSDEHGKQLQVYPVSTSPMTILLDRYPAGIYLLEWGHRKIKLIKR